MLTVNRHADARAFLTRAEEWLATREIEHAGVLQSARQARANDSHYERPLYWATIEDDGELIGCAYRTPPFKVGVTVLPEAAIAPLVADLAATYPGAIGGFSGPDPTVSECRNGVGSGARRVVDRETRGRLGPCPRRNPRHLPPPRRASCAWPSPASDRALAQSWGAAASIDSGIAALDGQMCLQLLAAKLLYFWADDQPRCMIGLLRETRLPVAVGIVYTPAAFRGQGYGTAALTALNRLLDERGIANRYLWINPERRRGASARGQARRRTRAGGARCRLRLTRDAVRREATRVRERPIELKTGAAMRAAGMRLQQQPGPYLRQHVREEAHLVLRDAAHKCVARNSFGCMRPAACVSSRSAPACGGGSGRLALACPARRALVAAADPASRHPWGSARMAGLGLQAAEREHEAARRVAPVGAERHGARHVERAHDLAAAAELDPVAQLQAHERVVHEQQSFLQRRADVVDELERRRARAAFGAVDDDEVGQEPRLDIALQIANHSHGWPMQSFKPVGLPPESLRSRSTNSSSATGVANSPCRAGLTQSSPCCTPRVAAISAVTFEPGSTPPWPGFAPWLSLTSIILTWSVARVRGEALGAEAPMLVAAAEVARAHLPDQVAAVHAVVAADRALTRVVREAALLRAAVQREDRVGGEGTEAHRRDVENARAVRLRALGAEPRSRESQRRNLRRHQRVVDPLVA